MESIEDPNEESDNISRRDLLRGAALAAGVAIASPSSYAQINKTMANKYGLYTKLQARAGKGEELGGLLLKAAKLMEKAEGCILYIVNKAADNSDGIYLIEVWDTKEDHDNSLNLPGVRALIAQAMPILGGKPDGITLEVLGGKGLG
jgi:quinol monooxygenase YgiN